MSAPHILLRAYKLKRAADRLKRAKENALRIHRGQRPRYPWYEELWRWSVSCSKDFCCRAFCPCCLATDIFTKSQAHSKYFLRRFCQLGTFENYVVKTLLGFVFGVFLSMCLFFFLTNQLSWNPRMTTVFCCLVGSVLTLGLAFSATARCVSLLVLPELFSNRGRVALLAYIYILVMSGPAKNAMRNANVLVESMSCGQELLANQTKSILRSVMAPLISIVDTMREVLQALKDFARQMKEAFIAIRDLFLEIISAIKSIFSWLLSIVKVCSSKYGSPYERCVKAFDDAIEDCMNKMGIFSFLCHVVTVVKFVCEIARVVDLLCLIPKAVNTGIIEPLKEQVKEFSRNMYNQFYVNITFVHYYNYSFEQSKTYEEIRGDISEEIKHRIEFFNTIIDVSDLCMSLFISFIVFKAIVYRIRYLNADHFDNVYITHAVRDIDDRRAVMDKETILPLGHYEKRKYVKTFSVRMGKKERTRLLTASVLLVMSGIQMCVVLILDYSLFQLLEMIRVHGRVKASGGMPSHVAMSVSGDGVLADMYRQLITAFDPVMGIVPEFDTTECLPMAVPIDIDKYQRVSILYSVCVLLALTEAYGLRLRHVICGVFYPHRERIRASWLHNHILKTRGNILKFLRRKIRRKYYGDSVAEDISFVDRIANKYMIINRILKAVGYSKIYCICCNQAGKPDDFENFKRCGTPGCKGLFCIPCFGDINEMCTICMNPVEYGDLSDISEEKDSSDEESGSGEKNDEGMVEAVVASSDRKATARDITRDYEDAFIWDPDVQKTVTLKRNASV